MTASLLSGEIKIHSLLVSGTPSVNVSEFNFPICLGGKFTTPSTSFSINWSLVYRTTRAPETFLPTSSPKSIVSLCVVYFAFGNSSTLIILPTRISNFWKSSKVAISFTKLNLQIFIGILTNHKMKVRFLNVGHPSSGTAISYQLSGFNFITDFYKYSIFFEMTIIRIFISMSNFHKVFKLFVLSIYPTLTRVVFHVNNHSRLGGFYRCTNRYHKINGVLVNFVSDRFSFGNSFNSILINWQKIFDFR